MHPLVAMRKTQSQDGGDSTSMTSGIENEIKKPGAILKTKRNSMKRKVQNFSHESDDAVIEPLLQKDKEKTDTSKQSAKHNLLSKAKTESNSQTGSDKDKLIPDFKLQNAVLSNASDITDSTLSTSYMKDNSMSKFTTANASLHNHMNTNVFSNHDSSNGFVTPKSQILVEIDGSKQVGYNPSSLIFTTAKIHTDSKTKHMEPVQVTPVPILSTIEVSVKKSGINKGEFSGNVNSNISTICTNIPNISTNITGQDQNPLFKMPHNTSEPHEFTFLKISDTSDASIKSSSSSNKCALTTKNDVMQNNSIKIIEGCPTNVANSQSTKPSTSHKITPNIQSETKSVTVTIPVTKTTSANNYTKGTGVLNPTVETTHDNTYYTPRYQEKKIELNNSVKQDSLDFQRSKADNVNLQSNTENPPDKTNTENTIANTSTQLRRQDIVIEKDNPISKLKPSIVSTSLSKDVKGSKKSDEYHKSSVTVENILSDKTKLPKSSANNVSVYTVTTTTDNKITKIASEDKMTAANKSSVSLNTSESEGKTAFPITTGQTRPTTGANKTSTALASTAKIKNTFETVTTTTPATGNKFSTSITSITVANKITTPLTTSVADNKTLASLPTIAAANKKSAPTSTSTILDKIPTSNLISSVNSNTNAATILSTSSNIIKPAIVTTTTGVGSIKSATTNTGTMSQVTNTKSNTPSSSTVSSRSTKASKVTTAITSFQPATTIKSPTVTTVKSHNIQTILPTTVAISTDHSLKSSTSNAKPSVKNNSINPAAAISTSLTLASSGSSSKSVASSQTDTKSNEINKPTKSPKA